MFSGATGNQPSQYIHAVTPLMCLAAPRPPVPVRGIGVGGRPLLRSGIIADSSASSRHSR